MSLRSTQLDQITWDFDLLTVTENKSVTRLAVQKPWASELVGVDGSIDGGTRPFQGFKFEKELDLPSPGADVYTALEYVVPVTIQAGSGAERFGFALFATLGGGGGNTREYLWSASSATPSETDPTDYAPWASSSFGSFCYIFTGNAPYRIYYDASDSVQRGVTVGPGTVPKLAGSESVYYQTSEQTNVPGSGWGLTRGSGSPSTADGPRICLFAFTGRAQAELGYASAPMTGPSALVGAGFSGVTLVYDVGNQPEFGTLDGVVGLEWTSGMAGASRLCSFAYQLVNENTGLRSQLSEVRTFDLSNKGLSVNAAGEAVLFPALSIDFDGDAWTHLHLYRSVAGNTGILSLDAIHEFTGDGRRLVFYGMSDLVLRQQSTFQGDATYEATLPKARSGIFLEGTLLYGDVAVKQGASGNAGAVRYSNPYELSAENVGTGNKIILQQPSEDVIRFAKVGSNAAGFTKQGVYIFRKDGVYISGFPMHKGFGITCRTAAAEVGPGVYYMTQEGMKFMGPDGTLEDVGVINELVLTTWHSTLDRVWMAYDATAHVLVVYNKTLGQMVLMWLKTGRVTEVHDCPFDALIEQNWQDTLGSSSSAAKPRVLFLSLVTEDGGGTAQKVRVWTIDYLRSGTAGRLFEISGNQRFTVSSWAGGSNPINLGETAPTRVGRLKVYVLSAADADVEGMSCTLLRSQGNLLYLSPSDAALISGLAAGDRIAVAPILFRWVGPPLPLRAEEGTEFSGPNFFRIRRIDSINCAFSDVAGSGESDLDVTLDGRWRGLVYKGTSATPVEKSFPVDTNGAAVSSIREGDSKYGAAFGSNATDGDVGSRPGLDGNTLAPGVEIMVADLDFRLLAVKCVGAIRSTERSDRAGV